MDINGHLANTACTSGVTISRWICLILSEVYEESHQFQWVTQFRRTKTAINGWVSLISGTTPKSILHWLNMLTFPFLMLNSELSAVMTVM